MKVYHKFVGFFALGIEGRKVSVHGFGFGLCCRTRLSVTVSGGGAARVSVFLLHHLFVDTAIGSEVNHQADADC